MDSPAVEYKPHFLSMEFSQMLMNKLLTYNFETPELVVRGRSFWPLRKTCSFADPGVTYTYNNFTQECNEWTQELLDVKKRVEDYAHCSYNFVLVTLYSTGDARIGAHRDDESMLDPTVPVSTVSLGATRRMIFSKPGEMSVSYPLETGSLLIMNNQSWLHQINREIEVKLPRISLTFRKIVMNPSNTAVAAADDDDDEPSTKRSRTEVSAENYTLKKYALGENIYLTVVYYNGEIRIHIREFYKNCHGDELPTKNGIYMSICTFYEFCKNVHGLTLLYTDESSIIHNSILCFVQDKTVQFRYITENGFSKYGVTLNIAQLNILKVVVIQAENTILKFKFIHELKQAVTDDFSYETDMSTLKNIIEQNLCNEMKSRLKCMACISSQQNMFHSCKTLNNLELYKNFSPAVRMLLDVKIVAESYLKDNIFLSRKCDFQYLFEELFQ